MLNYKIFTIMNKEQLKDLVAEVMNAEGVEFIRAAIGEEVNPNTAKEPMAFNSCFTPCVRDVAFILAVEYFCKGRTRDVYGVGAWYMLCGCMYSLIESSKGTPGAVSPERTMEGVEFIIEKIKQQHPELLNA